MPKNTYESMNLYQINNQETAILLKVEEDKKLFSVWVGNSEIDKNTHEEPLILKINNKDIFFYKSGIKEINQKDLILDEINQEYQLTNLQKQETLYTFAEKIDQTNLSQKIILLELKNQYLTKESWSLKQENIMLDIKNQDLTKENYSLKQENIILDIKNGDLNLKNSDLKLEAEEILDQKEPWKREVKKLKQQIIELQNENKIQKLHINELSNAKDSLCKVVGTSFDVHEIVTNKTKELLDVKGRPKEQYKSFVKQIAFVTQTFLDKLEKPKNFNYENEQSKLIKKFYDDEIASAMEKWKSFDKTPKQIKQEVLKNKKRLDKITEEYEF